MLVLTPEPLETAGERAFFGELARWDTGPAVRAAVVASLPLVDQPLGRRQSDAVLLVPEGLAVIRVVEVLRQSGAVTARPEGPWTIAGGSGPEQVLHLAGGGSSPLDGLMAAGMDTALKLRRAGLEPGRIARLTVLVGEITGLVPADGDLGEGDLVATLDPRSLLLAFARASRHAGVANPRLWTTADVRAALAALELPGRGPTLEELGGEAFPYSPYVLRRPQLLTPAAMAASPVVATPDAPEPGAGGDGREGEVLSATAVARAVAASVASAHAAAVAAAAPTGQRDTVEVDGAPAPPRAEETTPARPDAEPPAGPRTAVLPAASPAPRPPADQPPAGGVPAEPPARPPLSPAWGATASGRSADRGPADRRRIAVLAAAAVAVLVACVLGVWLLSGDEPAGNDAGGDEPAETSVAGPTTGEVREVDGTAFTVEAVQVDDTCVGHSYGEVAGFFAANDCVGLSRGLYSAQVEGVPVVVSVSRVTMADDATARELRALTDRNGSGNVSDLLREGVRYDGAPPGLRSAQYASAVSGSTVTVVESAWSGAGAGSTQALDEAASDGLVLPVPPVR
ncbi:hypothetical protein E9529_00460 [Blastococcus sp. KM273128]|uniref:hypothetical protein n=1 Tax=Blastococcus sp. KM273128 TaxID=2570314 RepID=UPI001F351C90|nr:hypothetical protein [Blastococcus sp. KM273128]MCF6742764.1 hypothetical protein [Blastococcus sp. KM273128]